MIKEDQKKLTKLNEKANNIFALLKFMKKNGKHNKGGRYRKGKDGRLDFSKKDKKRIRKSHMEEIMHKENDWDHVTEASVIEGYLKMLPAKNWQ